MTTSVATVACALTTRIRMTAIFTPRHPQLGRYEVCVSDEPVRPLNGGPVVRAYVKGAPDVVLDRSTSARSRAVRKSNSPMAVSPRTSWRRSPCRRSLECAAAAC